MSKKSILELADQAKQTLIPKKSKKKYDDVYTKFINWQKDNDVENDFSEDVFLAYFVHLRKTNAPNTLWAIQSMLKSEMAYHHDFNMKDYSKLLAYLKRENKGHKSKKALILPDEVITRFLTEADDVNHLANKVNI